MIETRTGVLPDEARRMLVAAQAADLFVEKGYARASLSVLLQRCRISRRTLQRLFPSKLALFAAAVEVHRDDLFLPPDDDAPRLDVALEHAFRVDIDPTALRNRVAFLRCAIQEAARDPELESVFRGYCANRVHRDLSEWLRLQHLHGRIVVEDAAAAAHMLLNMVFGMLTLHPVAEADWFDGAERRAYIRDCIAVFLRGIAVRRRGIRPSARG